MTNNKEIIDLLTTSEEIVEAANIDEKYKQTAFSKVFDLLSNRNKPMNSVMKQKNTNKQDSSEVTKIIGSSKTFAGFLRQTTVKSHAHKVICAAYYFIKQGKMTFTKEDIDSAYQSAFLPKSKNTSADINSLIKQGLVMPTKEKVEGKNCYQITMDGLSFVEEELIKK